MFELILILFNTHSFPPYDCTLNIIWSLLINFEIYFFASYNNWHFASFIYFKSKKIIKINNLIFLKKNKSNEIRTWKVKRRASIRKFNFINKKKKNFNLFPYPNLKAHIYLSIFELIEDYSEILFIFEIKKEYPVDKIKNKTIPAIFYEN